MKNAQPNDSISNNGLYVNTQEKIKIKISIPEHISESVKTQKINRIYDILSSEDRK